MVVYKLAIGIAIACIFASTSIQCMAATISAEKLTCGRNDKIRVSVESLAKDEDYAERFRLFETDPASAACYLIKQLKVVSEKVVSGYKDKPAQTMHVIWSLRALCSITGGLRFKGNTRYQFGKTEENRKYFLGAEENEVPFFAVWMSRDTAYIAPMDAQKEIINKWVAWYGKNGETFHYSSTEGWQACYF